LQNTNFAVLDFETTGLSPGSDRVVEVAVVHVSASQSPVLALNTLIDPQGPMRCTSIHGIRQTDVNDAPVFSDIAPDLLKVLSNRVFVGHNVYFDMRFLVYELEHIGVKVDIPYLCTMYMRTILRLGKRKPLGDVCKDLEIINPFPHSAAGDALATATLLQHYLKECKKQELCSFEDLAARHKFKFSKSFRKPLPQWDTFKVESKANVCKPRCLSM